MELKNILSLQKSTILDKKEYNDIVSKIPCNPIATSEVIASLKKVPEGESPLDLIFAVHFEESRNNRLYSIDAYKSIVNQILTSDVFIPVCYGHQAKDRVSWEGRKIVGSVVGAFLDEASRTVYYRIIPDASKNNEDIRRWIRNKQINSISIWGYSDSEANEEGVEFVKNFSLLSVDLVPPLSEGQENIALVIGEALNDFNNGIITNPKKDKEANMPEEKLKIEDVSNEALQGEMTKRMKDGRLSLKALAKQVNYHALTGEELNASENEKLALKNEVSKLLERAKSLGFKSLDELFDFTSETLKKFEEEKLEGEFKALKLEVMKEKGLIAEDGKPKGKIGLFIDRYAPIKQGMNREEIKAVIEKMLNDNEFTEIIHPKDAAGEVIGLHGEMLNADKDGYNARVEVFEI